MLANTDSLEQGHSVEITNPAQNDEIVGYVQEADLKHVEIALTASNKPNQNGQIRLRINALNT